uniref:C2H2-type domain-containing protein n=1 Tax=Periophthalmus magnuspinnatus TaxID=409849 RepID=A0A3B4BHW2_9GOBI
MCRLCNLFSPSHSQLLVHCSQVHQQQGSSHDFIITLQPLDPQHADKPTETPSKRKRGRPKGSANKRNKEVSPGYTEDNEEELGLECKQCLRTFSNRRQILKHICLKVEEEDEVEENDHNGSKYYVVFLLFSSPQIKIFTCKFCNKIFKFRHSLIAHLRTHTQEKPFKCPHCDYASAIKANLNVHLRKHTGDKFHCDHCSFTCISSGHLKVHIERVHLKVKQHCSFCKCKYSDVKNLLKHMERHHNLKDSKFYLYISCRLKTRQGFRQLLFHCPTCKRCFKSSQERNRHLLVHEPQPPFGCMLCEYAASRLSGLTAHVRKHFFLYVCSVCKGVFVSCHRLKTHVTESHPELDQDQTFTDCISSSYQLIQAGGGIWGQDSEKLIEQTSQEESVREEVIENIPEELQVPISQLEVDQNPPQDLEMGLLEHNTGLNSNPKVSSQSNQIELCQTLINSRLSEAENKTSLTSNLSEDSESRKEQECLVSDQKLSLAPNNGIPEESEVTIGNAFLQVLSSIQKTQLSIETLQQLRKVYGDLECEYCGKLFAYKVHYNNHVRTHTKEHLQYCSQCNYSAVTKSSLNRHMLHKHSDLMLSCPNTDCKFTTPDKYKLQAHTKTAPCPVCNNIYSEHHLKQHMRKMHPDAVSVEGKGRMEKQPDKCPYCDSYFLKNSNDFQQHIWAHEGIKPYTCDMCDYAGCRKSNLRLHMNRHKTEKIHLCDLCGKKFKSEVSLKIHTRSHTIEGMKFKCSECDFATALKPSLARHMEQHAFQCAHCYYSCNKVGPLKRHYKTKHPDEQYPDTELQKTEDPETQEKTGFKCPVCDSVHVSKKELNRHLKNKHRLNVLQISFEIAEEQEISPDQLMVVDAEEDLGADQVMVVEEAEGLEALTVLTQGDNTHHYIVYVQEQTVEIDNN